MKKALAIDVGGTKIANCIIDNEGKIISDIEKISTPKVASEIFDALKKIVEKYENDVDFVAIATAGAVSLENNRVISATGNLAKGYKDIDFSLLSKKRVYLENDANAAAYAEHIVGASKGYPNSIMITFGTGVGGGIILNNKLYKGKSGSAGEMHFIMDRFRTRSCTCGSYDCFEAYASGNGLRRTAIEIFKDENITTYDIIRLADENDERAKKALEIWQNDITFGIIGLQNLFDADCFVLSGSMEKFIDVEKVEKIVNETISTSPTKIFHGTAGNNSGMIGAALLGFHSIT